jgi:hypothetical protein
MNQQATTEEVLEEVSKVSMRPEAKNDCAGEDQQEFKRQTVRSRVSNEQQLLSHTAVNKKNILPLVI